MLLGFYFKTHVFRYPEIYISFF